MENIIAELIALVSSFFEIVFHLDVHLAALTQAYGSLTYLILFAIIFSETGLVVLPFLPGDSLLFAVGAVCALENGGLEIHWVVPLLVFAGVLGNFVNYSVGKFVGPKIFERNTFLINRDHLLKAQIFYEKHGAFAIILTRFLPIIRTFAPFVAGVARMSYSKFVIFNIVGALLWVGSLSFAGYIFGNLPVIQRNFHVVIIAIIGVSALPMILAWFKSNYATHLRK